MRHLKRGRKLGRDHEHRRALLRNQVRSLFLYGRITTTLAKAKEIRRYAEKMITLARKGDLASRRQARRFLVDRVLTNYVFEVFPGLFADRNSGFVRFYRLEPRKGDGAEMAMLELVNFNEDEAKKVRKRLGLLH